MLIRRGRALAVAAVTLLGVSLGAQMIVSAAEATIPIGTVVTVPTTVPHDCSVDVTSTLQSIINGAPDGTATGWTKIQFPLTSDSTWCYRIDTTGGGGTSV